MNDVAMPQLGETVTEATITRWLKALGDKVEVGESLFEVSTDKVDSDVPAAESGYLAEILADEGATIEVGTIVARITSTLPSSIPPPDGESAPGAQAIEATSGKTRAPQSKRLTEPAMVTPSSSRPMESPHVSSATASSPASTPRSSPSPGGGLTAGPGRQPLLSPSTRALLGRYGLDPVTVAATGPRGRITLADATSATAGRTIAPISMPASTAPQTSRITSRSADGTTVPFTNVRRQIAARMVDSKFTAPHAWVSLDIDFSTVEAARQSAKAAFLASEGFALTHLPFVSRAIVDALQKHPNLNSSISDDALRLHNHVNLGIAVDLDQDGLVVVAVREAETMRLRRLASATHDLARRARARQASVDEMTGSTFTISNVGSHGALSAMPIINQPEVAILGFGMVIRKPTVVTLPDGSEAIAIRPLATLAISWDHRAVDGAYATTFLRTVKRILETRDWTAELS